MSGLFGLQEWSFTTKCVTFALGTTLVPPLLLGAAGWPHTFAGPMTLDRLAYLAGAVGATVLATVIFRAFTQQAERIARLTAQLNAYTSTAVAGSDGGTPTDGVSVAFGKAMSLFKSQEAHLETGTATMQGLTSSIEHLASQVAQSAAVAEQTATQAQQGTSTVQRTLHGIRAMQVYMQETAKRIQHLDTHAVEVQEIGQRIADLADHTSVLAVNVSVQALRAGDGGENAAVVASEVERLASRTVAATQRIAHLINTIQRETTEVVAALDTRATELLQWTDATSEAGEVLQDIEQTASQLTALINTTSRAVAQQASSSAVLTKAMDEMTNVTQQTAAWTKQIAASMSNLSVLADSLHTSVYGERAA